MRQGSFDSGIGPGQVDGVLVEREKIRKEEEAKAQAKADAELEKQRQADRQKLEQEAQEQAKPAAGGVRRQGKPAAKQATDHAEADRLTDWLAQLRFIDGIDLHDEDLKAIQTDILLALDEVAKDGIARACCHSTASAV